MEVLVRPVIERITSEIMRTVQFFTDNAGKKVNAVFLTGGTAELQILRSHLAVRNNENLGIDPAVLAQSGTVPP